MHTRPLNTAIATIAATLLLAGCAAPGPENVKTSSAASVAAATSDHVVTSRYRIDVNYPQLPSSMAALTKALHTLGDKAKTQFMQAVPAPDAYPGAGDRQLQLTIDFTPVTTTARFVSVREKGFADTGGAHPMPIDAAIVYDRLVGQVIDITDLFTHPHQALEALSILSRRQLDARFMAEAPGPDEATPQARREWVDNMRGMLRDGTKPEAASFNQFLVQGSKDGKATGLQLLFPPYQVAPYVYGTQTVDVPATAIADLLKPAYRGAFVQP